MMERQISVEAATNMPNPDSPSQSDRVTELLKRRDECPLSSISSPYCDVTIESYANDDSQSDDSDHHHWDRTSGTGPKRILTREMDDTEMGDVQDGIDTRQNVKDSNEGVDLSIHSFDEADFLGEDHDGIGACQYYRDSNNVDDLSIHSFDEADFLSDGERDHCEKPLLDKRLNHGTGCKFPPPPVRGKKESWIPNDAQPTTLRDPWQRLDRQACVKTQVKTVSGVKNQRRGQVDVSLRRYMNRQRRLQKIQQDNFEQILRAHEAVMQDLVSRKAGLNDVLVEKWQSAVRKWVWGIDMCQREADKQRMEVSKRDTERIGPHEVCISTPQMKPSQEDRFSIRSFDLSDTETTLVVPFSTEDATELPLLTPPTPETPLFSQQVRQAWTSFSRVTDGGLKRPTSKTPPKMKYCLHHRNPRLAPTTNLTSNAKKLLTEGLEDLQQDLTKKMTDKGENTKSLSYIQPLTVEEVSQKKQEEDSGNSMTEKKKKKKNVVKRFFQWMLRKVR